MGERLTVQIDYCPKCCGVWLDRGKLDKIIGSSTSTPPMRRREDQDDDINSIWYDWDNYLIDIEIII